MFKGAAVFASGATFGVIVGGVGGLLLGITYMVNEMNSRDKVHNVTHINEAKSSGSHAG